MSTIHDVIQRVRAEYLEMPGLRLKAEQVVRLCGVERNNCQTALDALVGHDANGREDGQGGQTGGTIDLRGANPLQGGCARDRPENGGHHQDALFYDVHDPLVSQAATGASDCRTHDLKAMIYLINS